MPPNPQPSAGNKAPMWIIAFSLLTIAVCLVALVLRDYTGREPETELAKAAPPVAGTPTGDQPRRSVKPPSRSMAVLPPVATESSSLELESGSATQTAVQTSQTIVITPPLRGLALGAKEHAATNSPSVRGSTEPTGTVLGLVTLQSDPPPEKIFEGADCSGPATTHNYVVGENRGLANALIRLVPMPAPGPVGDIGTDSRTLSLVFTNCDMQPYLGAIAGNDRLVFRNPSPTKHVLELVLRDDGTPFATVTLEAGEEISDSSLQLRTLKTTHFLSARCALHAWERSSVLFSTQPRFTTTDLDGRFAITNVPPYAYSVELYHPPTFGTMRQYRNITLHAGATERVTFQIHPRH